jgi:hypothetical protein
MAPPHDPASEHVPGHVPGHFLAPLQHARGLLAGAMLCRFDHPATDCKVMGAEIARRLYGPGLP